MKTRAFFKFDFENLFIVLFGTKYSVSLLDFGGEILTISFIINKPVVDSFIKSIQHSMLVWLVDILILPPPPNPFISISFRHRHSKYITVFYLPCLILNNQIFFKN